MGIGASGPGRCRSGRAIDSNEVRIFSTFDCQRVRETRVKTREPGVEEYRGGRMKRDSSENRGWRTERRGSEAAEPPDCGGLGGCESN